MFIHPEQIGVQTVDLGGRSRYAVGGTLFVTQYRLLFETIPLNRITGQTSILLDTISDVRDDSAFLQPRIALKAGIPYEFLLFRAAQPLATIHQIRARSTAQTHAEARANQIRSLFPQGMGDKPPRLVVRTILDNLIAMPSTVLRALSLYNLWLSLGDADQA